MARSKEVFWWSLFSAGGALAALFMPALILVTGFALPYMCGTGEGIHKKLQPLVAFWPVRIVLFGVIALSFFHCAHRIRHTLMDLGLRPASTLLGVLCYGGALAGAAAALCALRTF